MIYKAVRIIILLKINNSLYLVNKVHEQAPNNPHTAHTFQI